MQDTGWDHALKVTGDGEGLVGHAGAVLLRKLADQAGLTAALGPALARAGKFPLVDQSTGPDVWGRLGDDRFEMSHQVIALDAGGRLSADRPMNPGRSSV